MEFLSRQKLCEQEPPVMYTHVKRIRESILSHNKHQPLLAGQHQNINHFVQSKEI